jgi:cytochrome c5
MPSLPIANMPEHDPHTSPIKTPKQLLIVVVLAFLVPVAIIGLVSQLVTSTRHDASSDEQRVLERIKPVGTVVIADASAPKGNLTGEQVYAQVCKTCHEAGIAGAPKTGDKAAWTPRLAQGENTVVQHAVAGFQGKTGVMPPKGGNTDLTDEEVHRAVVYLANQAGGNWKEPPATAVAAAPTGAAPAGKAAGTTAPAAAATAGAPAGAAATTGTAPAAGGATAAAPAKGAAATAPATAAAPAAAPAAVAAAGGASADGKATYDKVCAVCHASGLAGAPKFGDKAAWAPRIATGVNTLHSSALKGKNAMPPKGGNMALPDADVVAAVDYMVAAAK